MQPPAYLGYYPESELVLAIVCPLGTNYRPIVATIRNYVSQFGYETNVIQLSDEFDDLLLQLGTTTASAGTGAVAGMRFKISAGNEIRRLTQNDVLALVAASRIASYRKDVEQGDAKPLPLQAHVIVSLKRPEEVEALRRVYGAGFFLIGIASSESERAEVFQ